MDLEDLLSGWGSTRTPSRTAQIVIRIVFGLFLAAMAAAGAWKVATTDAGTAFRAAGVLMFIALAAFGALGIAAGIAVRRLGWLFLASVAALFVVRIVFGP